MERWFAAPFRASPELALWRNMLARTGSAGYIAACRALATADQTGATAALDLPTLVVAGSEDGASPPAVTHGPTTSPHGKTRSFGAPRPDEGRLRQAGLLAHGSQPIARRLPRPSVQWLLTRGLAAYSCGGSPGVAPEFPLSPLAGKPAAAAQ